MTAEYVSNVEYCRIQHISHEWPSGLKTASEMAGMFGLTAEKFTNLAECGYLPLYKVDDGELLFKPSESARSGLPRTCSIAAPDALCRRKFT